MAANNYYHDPYARNDHNNTAYSNDWRADSSSRPQPSTSPFDDRQYGYSRNPSQSSDGIHQYPSNPFDERNTIPLDRRQKKHDSTASVAPILEPPPHDDPFVRDAKRGRSRRRDRWFKGKVTYVCFVLTFVQLIVFIAELIKNGILTKTPIEIHPSFNPMIGPSPYLLINMGARYVPCMHNMPNVQNASLEIMWPCPNATATTGDSMTLGRDVEQLIGSVRFALVYFAAGIFGFVLGGNFAATGIASCGCSGSLFGILAITLLDLLYTWSERKSPIKDLLFIVLDVCIAFVLGLLPGLDNFSHIGGFCMGLVLGICILRSPTTIARRTSLHNPSYSGVTSRHATADADEGLRGFIKQPLQFFQDRRGVWWAWWAVRAFCLIGALVGFILLLKNFYVWRTGCGWCKYLSCLPIKTGGTDWCNVGNLDFTPTSTGNGTSKRDLFGMGWMGWDGVGRML
ncbi:hypothetical protein LTR95_005274 [Oleoguttula sp. CCFEE 5521]